jgi:hypothetical protein
VVGGVATTLGVLGAAAIRVVRAVPLVEDAEPEHEYPTRMAKKKDHKKIGSGPRTRHKKQKKGK